MEAITMQGTKCRSLQWRTLWSFLLLGLLAVNGTHAKLSGLRHTFSFQEDENQGHRQLAEFRTPFVITWRIEIGNGASDRQPTAAERQGVVDATSGWLEDNINNIYTNTAGLQLANLQASLVSSQTSWNPGAADYPHTIQINCTAIWQASSAQVVPEVTSFLLTINAQATVNDFIVHYLLVDGPSTSIYHFSQRVAYALATLNAASGSSPSVPTPSPGTPAPAPTVSFPNTYVIPIKLTFALGMGSSFSYRQATAQEYSGAQNAAERWLLNSLQAAYSRNTTFSVKNVTSSIVSTQYITTAGEQYPYTIVLDAYAIIQANSLANVPTVLQFIQTIGSDSVSLLDFVQIYLRNSQPQSSIFRSTVFAQFGSDYNGPRLPASVTLPPGATPAPHAPTSAPVRATPSPVNPGDLIATVSTKSNWTYTISGEFGIQDRQPTQAEYQGLVESTHEWLTRIFNQYYNVNNQDKNYPQFVGVETKLVRGIYRPSSGLAPHLVMMNIDFTFALDPNDETQVVPFLDSIYNVVAQADLNQYVFLYVHSSEPIATSVFHGVNSVNWIYDLSDTYTYVPRPTQPPTGGGELGSSTGIDRTRLRNAQSNSVSFLMRYRLVDTATNRAPTQAEWNGLLEATRSFWNAKLTQEYKNIPNADFVMVDAKWYAGTTSFSAGQNFPYQARLQMEVLFTEGSTMETDLELRSRMSGLYAGSDYVPTYIRSSMPVTSLFRNTLQIQWNY